jgi:hypothetical protein
VLYQKEADVKKTSASFFIRKSGGGLTAGKRGVKTIGVSSIFTVYSGGDF